jgi:Tfp pilus assembly protein PilN
LSVGAPTEDLERHPASQLTMKLRLNLSTAPRENKRPFLAAATLIGTVGLLALLILGHAALNSWRANREIRLDMAHWEGEIRANTEKQQILETYFQTPQARQVLDQAAFLNSLIGERSFPWTKIFMDLEQTLPPGVRVVSISPRLESGRAQVTLTVAAATDEGKIKFLETLENSKLFSGIEVKSERRQDQQGPGDKIVLDLTVWYETT